MIKRLFSMAVVIGATIVTMVLAPSAAWADKRVALVIGNSAYENVPKLPNPARDANAVAKMFRDAGFDSVAVAIDVGNLEFKRAIRKFEEASDDADIAVVYYAGHGLEIAGSNYLIPIDAKLASDRDADDEAIPLERLVSSADGARRLRLVILDACRDNPFIGKMRRERTRTASRGLQGGLGKVEPTETDTLIAYAAKAGSTAEDGDGNHSPFTTAILKDLPVPGLDVRLAFGRVRDEVMKSTGSRQEPFVYGSLGGNNVALVPAPAKPQEAPMNEVKADYELVQKIGTQRAWEVFLGTHPTGFYADLARAQIDALNKAVAVPPPAPPSSARSNDVASLEPNPIPSRPPTTQETLEWSKVKDSTDIAALQKFIKRFPDGPLAITAQQRIDVLKRQAQERQDAQRKADAQKAAEAAQKQREEDERRAAAAEAAEKARAAAAEAAAQKKREEDERQAAAAEAARQAKQAEADRKAREAQQQAAQAAHAKAVAEAAAAAAVAQKQAEEAEAARRKADLAAQKEATCKDEQGKLDAILAKGSQGTGVEDLKQFSRTVTCDRLGAVVAAGLERFNAEVAKRTAEAPNSLPLVRSAQTELIRLGCFTGRPDGSLTSTQAALSHYNKIEGLPANNPVVTKDVVADLVKHSTRVCPLECNAGETLKGDVCIVDKATPAPSTATASRKNSDEDNARSRRKQAAREREQEQPRRREQRQASQPEPRARQQALARPSITYGGGGGGGGHSTMVGVGF